MCCKNERHLRRQLPAPAIARKTARGTRHASTNATPLCALTRRHVARRSSGIHRRIATALLAIAIPLLPIASLSRPTSRVVAPPTTVSRVLSPTTTPVVVRLVAPAPIICAPHEWGQGVSEMA